MNKNLILIFGTLILLAGFVVFNNFNSEPQTSTQNQTPTSASQSPSSLIQVSINCNGQPIAELTEGPYYTTNTPEKSNLTEPGIPGEKLILTGYVLTTDCKPIPGAWIDFWQADGAGNYDNSGYKLRGHQFSDQNGRYTLTTVIPGEYPGRTPHIHFKIRANDSSPIITSQLFIPGVAGNETDSIYNDSLLISNVQQSETGKTADFNFVINN